jgi:hypothetical protein
VDLAPNFAGEVNHNLPPLTPVPSNGKLPSIVDAKTALRTVGRVAQREGDGLPHCELQRRNHLLMDRLGGFSVKR